jgi:methyl-accepting chemotaxis protein
MIAKATENAQNTSESSSESHKKAEEGRGSVDQMLTSMDEISQSNEAILTQINDSNRQMSDIVKVIQDIGNRTKVINEIVFQQNCFHSMPR